MKADGIQTQIWHLVLNSALPSLTKTVKGSGHPSPACIGRRLPCPLYMFLCVASSSHLSLFHSPTEAQHWAKNGTQTMRTAHQTFIVQLTGTRSPLLFLSLSVSLFYFFGSGDQTQDSHISGKYLTLSHILSTKI